MVLDVITAAAGVATAVTVGLAALQLHQAEQHREAAFELRFSDRYDDCVGRIPLDVLLGEREYDSADEKTRRAFYDYFELCEQECHYHFKGEISDPTWADWCDGIRTNRKKQSFVTAWQDLSSSAATQFEQFRQCFPDWAEA